MHFVDDLKRVRQLLALAEVAVVYRRRFHLLFDAADGIEVFNIENDVKNNRGLARRGGQGSADLLLIDNGADGRAQEDDAGDVVHMHPFVQHVDAVEELEVVASVRLEVREGPGRRGVIGIGGIDMRMRIHEVEPVLSGPDHLGHVLEVRAEDEILPRPVRHVLCEELIHADRVFQRPPQLLDDLFGRVPGRPAFRAPGPQLILCEIVLVLEDREHILRCRQDSPDNGLAQAHLRGDLSVKKLLGHVALAVEVTDVRGGQTDEQGLREALPQAAEALAPDAGAGAVHLVREDHRGPQSGELVGCQDRELGVGEEGDIGKVGAACDSPGAGLRPVARLHGICGSTGPFPVFQLGRENVLGRGQPQDSFVRMIRGVLEADEALPRSGRMDDAGLAAFFQPGEDFPVSCTVVRE